MTDRDSVEIPLHIAYDEAARQLGLPRTSFHLDHEENILHYRYLANEVYKLRNFLTGNFGQFEGPTIPHAIEMIRILGKVQTPETKPKEDPSILKEVVKNHLREYFSQPVLMDMLTCVDNLIDRFGVSRALASQYLIEVVKEQGARQIGHMVYGRQKEPILEAAMGMGPMTKTRLIEVLARTFDVGQETMCEELDAAISRAKVAAVRVEKKGPLIKIGPIMIKSPKKALTKAFKKKKK
jgi:hypothetical protein